jgi:hypothetical protein
VGEDSQPDQGYCLEYRRITQPDLGSNLPRREFQFETLYDPQPLFIRYPKTVDPSASEIMKRISTSFTTEPFTNNPVDFIPVTPYAETTVVFPT